MLPNFSTAVPLEMTATRLPRTCGVFSQAASGSFFISGRVPPRTASKPTPDALGGKGLVGEPEFYRVPGKFVEIKRALCLTARIHLVVPFTYRSKVTRHGAPHIITVLRNTNFEGLQTITTCGARVCYQLITAMLPAYTSNTMPVCYAFGYVVYQSFRGEDQHTHLTLYFSRSISYEPAGAASNNSLPSSPTAATLSPSATTSAGCHDKSLLYC